LSTINTAGISGSLYQKPPLAISNPQAFSAIRAAVESVFSSAKISDFLTSLERAGVRIRNFEGVLGKGLLGPSARATYSTLDNGDQGQIRELYLGSLERVGPELREKFFKLYSYY
jgi:hypothetical protein